MSHLLEAYDRILRTLEVSAQAAGVPVPQLMVVTKNQPHERLIPLLKRGHRLFGENRVQEAVSKWASLKAIYPDIRLHLIGPLQRNKVPEALRLFHAIETIDRHSLVDAVVHYRDILGVSHSTTKFLIQVNIGQEPQKSGVDPDDLAALYGYCLDRDLPVSGLMCIPPANEPPAPYFKHMQQLAQTFNPPDLSMGMSDDYAIAATHGSTWVRIGSAIFEEAGVNGK